MGQMPVDSHEHEWRPDGESWSETNHHPSCAVPDSTGHAYLSALKKCECEQQRKRTYTCHCGASKEVKIE